MGKLTTIVVLATVALLLAPSSAHAASYHDISGTTWSDSTRWYLSSNDRYKEGYGNIYATFSRLPTFSNGTVDGLYFQATRRDGTCLPGNCFSRLFGSTDTELAVAYSIEGGTVFRFAFARKTTCQNGCIHDFSGKSWY